MDRRAEKMSITATVGDLFEELKSHTNNFLIHHYVKRKQAVHMEKLISECGGISIVLQVDFCENASLLTLNEIQPAHWNHTQAIIFTAQAWVNENSSRTFAIASDHLSHTKCLYIYENSL